MSSQTLQIESDSCNSGTVETCSVSWRTRARAKKAALFRTYRSVAVLQHVRTTVVRTGRGESVCEIDDTPHLRDIPEDVLAELRSEGFDVVADHDRATVGLGGARQ